MFNNNIGLSLSNNITQTNCNQSKQNNTIKQPIMSSFKNINNSLNYASNLESDNKLAYVSNTSSKYNSNNLIGLDNASNGFDKMNLNYILRKEFGITDTDQSVTDSMLNNEEGRIQRISYRMKSLNLKQANESRFEKFFSMKKDPVNKTQILIDGLKKKGKNLKNKSCVFLTNNGKEFKPFSEIEDVIIKKKKNSFSTKIIAKVPRLSPAMDNKNNIIYSDTLGAKTVSTLDLYSSNNKFNSENILEKESLNKISTSNLYLRFKHKKEFNYLLNHDLVKEDMKEYNKTGNSFLNKEDLNNEDNQESMINRRHTNNNQNNKDIRLNQQETEDDSNKITNNIHFRDASNCFTENLYNKTKLKNKFRNETNYTISKCNITEKDNQSIENKSSGNNSDNEEDNKSALNNNKLAMIRNFDEINEENIEDNSSVFNMNNIMISQVAYTISLNKPVNKDNAIESKIPAYSTEPIAFKKRRNSKYNSDNTYLKNNPISNSLLVKKYINKNTDEKSTSRSKLALNSEKTESDMRDSSNMCSPILSVSVPKEAKEAISIITNMLSSLNNSTKIMNLNKIDQNSKFNFYNNNIEIKAQQLPTSVYANEYFKIISDENTKKLIILAFPYLSDSMLEELNKTILKAFEIILGDSQSLEFIYMYFQKLQEFNKNTLINEFITKLDVENLSLSANSKNFLVFLKSIKIDSVKTYLLSLIKKDGVIDRFIFDKYGKSLVEFFLDDFYPKDQLFKLTPLIFIIETRLIDYSVSNFSTFIIQKYIRLFKSDYSYETVKNNILTLGVNRNGVFVIVAALESYSSERALELSSIIINKLMSFITEKYASTLIEFVFKHFPVTVDWFLERKSDFILDIIEDQYGNFVIQKLLQNLKFNTPKKLSLLNLISFKLPSIKKNNVKKKWAAIVRQGLIELHCDIQVINTNKNLDINSSTNPINIPNSQMNQINSQNKNKVNNNIYNNFPNLNSSIYNVNHQNPQYNVHIPTQIGNYHIENPNTSHIPLNYYQIPQSHQQNNTIVNYNINSTNSNVISSNINNNLDHNENSNCNLNKHKNSISNNSNNNSQLNSNVYSPNKKLNTSNNQSNSIFGFDSNKNSPDKKSNIINLNSTLNTNNTYNIGNTGNIGGINSNNIPQNNFVLNPSKIPTSNYHLYNIQPHQLNNPNIYTNNYYSGVDNKLGERVFNSQINNANNNSKFMNYPNYQLQNNINNQFNPNNSSNMINYNNLYTNNGNILYNNSMIPNTNLGSTINNLNNLNNSIQPQVIINQQNVNLNQNQYYYNNPTNNNQQLETKSRFNPKTNQ